jgi:hypothetical protein
MQRPALQPMHCHVPPALPSAPCPHPSSAFLFSSAHPTADEPCLAPAFDSILPTSKRLLVHWRPFRARCTSAQALVECMHAGTAHYSFLSLCNFHTFLERPRNCCLSVASEIVAHFVRFHSCIISRQERPQAFVTSHAVIAHWTVQQAGCSATAAKHTGGVPREPGSISSKTGREQHQSVGTARAVRTSTSWLPSSTS